MEMVEGKTVREALHWHPERSMRWLVFERGSDVPPSIIEGPAHWMWHSGNMYAEGSELVCDWVAYDDPFHFLGPDAAFLHLMR